MVSEQTTKVREQHLAACKWWCMTQETWS